MVIHKMSPVYKPSRVGGGGTGVVCHNQEVCTMYDMGKPTHCLLDYFAMSVT